eukprot:364756-Chlamydomonas_euryale.AAC.5
MRAGRCGGLSHESREIRFLSVFLSLSACVTSFASSLCASNDPAPDAKRMPHEQPALHRPAVRGSNGARVCRAAGDAARECRNGWLLHGPYGVGVYSVKAV